MLRDGIAWPAFTEQCLEEPRQMDFCKALPSENDLPAGAYCRGGRAASAFIEACSVVLLS